MMTPDTAQARTAWDSIAPSFDEHLTSLNTEVANTALDRVELRPGMRVLDVAAGSGALSIAAAKRGAHVLATDLSPRMIELLARRAHREGLTSIEARPMDGHALDLPDNSFDLSASQFGVMLFPDMPRGLRELARVTKPGGKVLVVAFGPLPTIEFISFFVRAMQAVAPDVAATLTDSPPLPFQLQDPERLRQELAATGLTDIRVETVTVPTRFPSVDRLWNAVKSGHPISGAMLARLSTDQRAAVRQALADLFRERSGGDGSAILTADLNVAVGTKADSASTGTSSPE
jgi:ubiquinone/menaquinone biosynthesis C-methylase UbiE